MRIVKLEAENVKRLKAVAITPGDDALVKISGENGQGKSSVLDSIAMALGGKNLQPPEPIRRGQKDAMVRVELDDLVVERRWTGNDKSTLTVRSRDGVKMASPQAVLDKLVGKISFDPMAFLSLQPKQQRDHLTQLVGADVDTLDQRRQALLDKKSHASAKLAELEAQLAPLKTVPETKRVSVSELLDQQADLTAVKEANDRVRLEATRLHDVLLTARRELAARQEVAAKLAVQLAEAQLAVKAAEQAAETAAAADTQAATSAKALVDPDVTSVVQAIRNAEATNAAAKQCEERAVLEGRIGNGKVVVQGHVDAIKALDAERLQLLAAAKFPVPGLGFSADGVTFNGLPLEQASQAEQLRVSLGMGIALNPALKVLLIRDGSLLDKKSLALVAEMAAAAGCQVWIELVGNGAGDATIIIEDGMVAGAPANLTDNVTPASAEKLASVHHLF